jgi:hypothetical protein
MGTVTLHEFDDALLRSISELAERNGRTVEREIEELLRESLSYSFPRANLRQLMDRIAAMTPPGAAQTDSVELLRLDRGR